MSILFPRARIGLSRHFGAMFDAERRNGLEILAMGDQVVMHIWKDGVKFYTVEAPPQRAQQIAELLDQAARYINRAGAGALAPRLGQFGR